MFEFENNSDERATSETCKAIIRSRLYGPATDEVLSRLCKKRGATDAAINKAISSLLTEQEIIAYLSMYGVAYKYNFRKIGK